MSNDSVTDASVEKLLLVAGFGALLAAVLGAHWSPATEYEVSIYAGTPTVVWLGLGVALLVSLTVSLSTNHGPIRGLALSLGGLATAAVAGMPLLRSYRYLGTFDAMTHLGWARELANGTTTPLDLIYPGIHSLAALVHGVAGLGLERSVMLVVLVAFAVLLAFVPLTVRAIVDRGDATVFGAFAAFLLLPLNNVSTHPVAHPFTQTVLFSAAVLYFLVRYVRQPREPRATVDPTAIGALLALAGAAAVVYHPQQAANLVVLFVAISVVQFAYRRWAPGHAIADHRPLYAQTAFLAAVFLAWSARYELVAAAVEGVAASIAGYLTGNPPGVATAVQTQGASLAAIGVSVTEIFLKLFLVSAVFSLLAGALIAAYVLGWLDPRLDDRNAIVAYLGAGVVAITPLFVVYLFGSISEQYFRHFGFLMLLVTVLGALALTRWYADRPAGLRGDLRTTAVAVGLVAMLALALVAAFPSPYVYKATPHVTDQQLSGYEAAFEYHDGEVDMLGVRSGPLRYSHGLLGVADRPRYRVGLPDEGLVDPRDAFEEPGTLVVSQLDREREVVAYRQLRYSERGFGALGTQPGVSQVQSNGDLSVYYVDPDRPSGGFGSATVR